MEHVRLNAKIASIGIGTDVSFDKELINLREATIRGYDPTPTARESVKTLNNSPFFTLRPYAVSNFNGMGIFEPVLKNGVGTGNYKLRPYVYKETNSAVVEVKSITEIIKNDFCGKVDLLKIDAEGEEYKILECLLNSRYRPIQIAVEFHHRFEEIGLEKTYNTVYKLRCKGYRLIKLSDQGPEYTFLYQPH